MAPGFSRRRTWRSEGRRSRWGGAEPSLNAGRRVGRGLRSRAAGLELHPGLSVVKVPGERVHRRSAPVKRRGGLPQATGNEFVCKLLTLVLNVE